jgi:hypothetical protein
VEFRDFDFATGGSASCYYSAVRRWLLWGSPAAAVAIVAWAVLGAGSEPIRYVQVLGGPTRSGAALSVSIRALTLDGQRTLPAAGLAVRAIARSGASDASVVGTTDESGLLEARFELGAAPESDPWLQIESDDSRALLAEGRVALDRESWQAGARREGGWLPGQAGGELHVRVAAASGVFAVPFEGALLVQVHDPREPLGDGEGESARAAPGAMIPLAGATITVEPSGAELDAPAVVQHSDALGTASIGLRPTEHAISVRVLARLGSRQGQWYGALPVVPGALLARRDGGRLEVRSPIRRERAYVSLVTRDERVGGMSVALAAEPDGGARGSVELPLDLLGRFETEPAWAVVSSEYDKRSAGSVGWPIGKAIDAAPPATFDVADVVLLDGRAGALYDAQHAESARRRVAGGLLLGVAVLTGALFWAEIKGSRARRGARSERGASGTAASGLDAPNEPALASRGAMLGAAVLCIALGLAALAYFALVLR